MQPTSDQGVGLASLRAVTSDTLSGASAVTRATDHRSVMRARLPGAADSPTAGAGLLDHPGSAAQNVSATTCPTAARHRGDGPGRIAETRRH